MIASLSGPLQAVYEPDLEQAVVVLERMGFRVRRAPPLEAGRHHWWSAATPTEIVEEFNGLLRDPEVRAIIAHDGGQTALGYLDLIDVDAIVADPKPAPAPADDAVLADSVGLALLISWREDGTPISVLAFTVANGRITEITAAVDRPSSR